jgi:hypothetical protein
MQRFDLHLREIAGWRALLTEAQLVAAEYLPEAVEEYLVCLLYRAVGQPGDPDTYSLNFLESFLKQGPDTYRDPCMVGDQCLLFAGLFPEHAIGKGIPITYFVQVGQNAYGEYGARAEDPVYRELSAIFVTVMDVLHTLRELSNGSPCIDGMNAYQLWHDTGSQHAWQVLRRLTPALPARDANTVRH